MNLFSIFDPSGGVGPFIINNWVVVLLWPFLLPPGFWLGAGHGKSGLESAMSLLVSEKKAILSGLFSPGAPLLLAVLFVSVFMSNMMGLFPFVFTSTSHLALSVSLGVPLWAGTVVMGSFYQPGVTLAHLVPVGTPGPLMPMMVLIETVSILIRPVALSVRLVANMVAGHLMLSLLSGASFGLSLGGFSILLAVLVVLLVLELAVAAIQAYVFTILSTLYVSDSASPRLAMVG